MIFLAHQKFYVLYRIFFMYKILQRVIFISSINKFVQIQQKKTKDFSNQQAFYSTSTMIKSRIRYKYLTSLKVERLKC